MHLKGQARGTPHGLTTTIPDPLLVKQCVQTLCQMTHHKPESHFYSPPRVDGQTESQKGEALACCHRACRPWSDQNPNQLRTPGRGSLATLPCAPTGILSLPSTTSWAPATSSPSGPDTPLWSIRRAPQPSSAPTPSYLKITCSQQASAHWSNSCRNTFFPGAMGRRARGRQRQEGCVSAIFPGAFFPCTHSVT